MSEPQKISENLRCTRLQQGKSLEDVRRTTGLSANVVQALEEGRFDLIEPVFMRLALRAYAEYLGLDPAAVLKEFDQTMGSTGPAGESAPLPRPSRVPPPSSWRWAVPAIAALGVLALIALFSGLRKEPEVPLAPLPTPLSPRPRLPSSRPRTPETLKTEEQSPANPEPARADTLGGPRRSLPLEANLSALGSPVASDQAALQPSPAPAAASESPGLVPKDSLLVLEVEALDSTWVEIKGDGNRLFMGNLLQGQKRSWQARETFVVHAGRSHGLRYWLQGRPLGDNGRLGEVNQVLRFKADRGGVTLLDADFQPFPAPGDAAQPDSARPRP